MQLLALAGLAFLTSTAAAWAPSCGWSNCMTSWQPGSCSSTSHWDCLCGNSTAVSQVNSCVASSCSNTTDQEAIYAAVAQLCANNGHTVTNSPEATFSATSGGNVGPSVTGRPGGWNGGNWNSWVSACSTAIGAGWGSNHPTPTAGAVCQPVTGWSASYGPWTAAWTWTHCSGSGLSTVRTTMTMTTTNNGVASVMTTATSVVVQAAVQAASTDASGATTTVSGNIAAPTQHAILAVYGGAAAAAFGLMLAL